LNSQLVSLLEQPPSKERDSQVALALLGLSRVAKGRESERFFISGYSYARTSRDPAARRLAEERRSAFPDW